MYCFFRGAVAARMFWIIIAFGQCIYSQYFLAALFFYHGNGILSINDNIHWYEIYAWIGCLFSKPFRNSRRKNPQEEQKKEQIGQSSVFWKVHNRPSHSSIALAVLIWIVFFFSSAGFIWNAQKHGKVSIHTLFFLLSLYPTLPFYL